MLSGMSESVVAAVRTAPRTTELREFPMPAIPDDGALLRVEVAGICGTDVKLYQHPPGPAAVIMGHENIGTIAKALPEIVGGSADLAPSNNTMWPEAVAFSKADRAGNYMHWGVREFGMSAAMNGMTLHGGLIPFGGTFLMFSEYARNALRMAALMKVPSIFVYTHDSIGLGEDGPTHQPVEQTATLRLIPNMRTWRPCDAVESAVAWRQAVERKDGPTCLVFSRQNLPCQDYTDQQVADITRGGYVLSDCEGTPDAIIIATGFSHFDPARETQMYGYYEFPDVVTLSDLEGMLSERQVVRPSNGQPPERVCFIQCVGSRDRHIGNEYCSKVCCGVASKEAIELRLLLPSSKVYIFYIDMRMYGYWENEIYWPAQEKHHVQYVKGMITEVLAKGDRLLVRGEDTTMGRPMELEMDMVVLSVGMEPSPGTRQVSKMLGVEQNKYGFVDAVAVPLDTVSTSREGIFACGAALGPADLEDSVSSGAAAAMKAFAFLRSRAAAAAS